MDKKERMSDDGRPYYLTQEETEDLRRDAEETVKWMREHWDEIN